MMLFRLIDKMLFAALLLVGLQVPQLSEHFLQYMSGYFDATAEQVEGYTRTARDNGFATVEAMIDDHLQNPSPSVRQDARQKTETLARYEELSAGMALFQQGNLIQKSIYMFNPEHADMLSATMKNFEPGIPLSPGAFLFALVLAILTNMLLGCPWYFYQWRKRRKLSYRRLSVKKSGVKRPRGIV